jgi:hypothetical protein
MRIGAAARAQPIRKKSPIGMLFNDDPAGWPWTAISGR